MKNYWLYILKKKTENTIPLVGGEASVSTSKNTRIIKNEYLDIIDGCFDDDILQYIT